MATNEQIEALRQELEKLSDVERAAVMKGWFRDYPPACFDYPLLPFEQDLAMIIHRIPINTETRPLVGSTINVGETFAVDIYARNCTRHNLRNIKLKVENTPFASVILPDPANPMIPLGNALAGATFPLKTIQCRALSATPHPSPERPDVLIRFTQVTGNIDLCSSVPLIVDGYPSAFGEIYR